MKLEDATWQWVDSICGEREGYSRREAPKYGLFHTFDYVEMEGLCGTTRSNIVKGMQIITGGELNKEYYSVAKCKSVRFCTDGEIKTMVDSGPGLCEDRDVTEAFLQLEFPENDVDDIIMEIAFIRSEERQDVVKRWGRSLMKLLPILKEERRKFLGVL